MKYLFILFCLFLNFNKILSQGNTTAQSQSISKIKSNKTGQQTDSVNIPTTIPPKVAPKYSPKETPSTENLSAEQIANFSKGVDLINTEQYAEALDTFIAFANIVHNDSHCFYNLALMFEADHKYKAAIGCYDKYKILKTDTLDREDIKNKIASLIKEYRAFIQSNKNSIKADRAYIKLYFEKIQNGESIALAVEFIEFIKARYTYYAYFNTIIESDDKPVRELSKSIADLFLTCIKTIKKNPQAWDREAAPKISMIYLDLDDLDMALK